MLPAIDCPEALAIEALTRILRMSPTEAEAIVRSGATGRAVVVSTGTRERVEAAALELCVAGLDIRIAPPS